MKQFVDNMKENILAVLLAFILAVSIVFLISNVEFLKADIAGFKKSKNEALSYADFIVYKNSSGFKLVSNKNFQGVQSIIVDIVYDSKKIKLTDKNVVNDNVSMSFIDTGQVEFQIIPSSSIKKGDTILQLKDVNGNYINLNSLQIIFTDGKIEDTFDIATVNSSMK